MTKFVYYNNDNTIYGNPTSASNYYMYLTGVWKNNTPITYGGSGHTSTLVCNYMFPGTSDPNGWGVGGNSTAPLPQTNWSESSAGNAFGDRRFLESAGPFTLQPGAINYVTTAVIWARATSGGPLASLQSLMAADDLAQNLFNNCFVSTGISTLKKENLNITLYPNPFYEKAIISFANPNSENYKLTIYDLTGKVVQEYENEIKDYIIIERGQLKPSTYIYMLSNLKNKLSLTGKFIIR